MKRLHYYCLVSLTANLLINIPAALAVDPNALESAYWRFESGTNGTPVTPGDNVVPDSINSNDMSAFNADTAPTYTSTVAPFPLRSAAANNLALNFISNAAGGGDDLYTVDRQIDNGIIGPPVAPNVTGFTIEAAFRPNAVDAFQAIVAKNGLPGGSLPTLALKVRGDNGNLHVEQYDKAGSLVGVQSTSSLTSGQWYAAAAVNDGTNLSLYLLGESNTDYVFQGSTPVNGALYQGTADDWDKPWSIGRAVFGGSGDGNPADWFNGIIDEVRLTNRALDTSEFLFKPVPEPQTFALAAVALVGLTGGRFYVRRRK